MRGCIGCLVWLSPSLALCYFVLCLIVRLYHTFLSGSLAWYVSGWDNNWDLVTVCPSTGTAFSFSDVLVSSDSPLLCDLLHHSGNSEYNQDDVVQHICHSHMISLSYDLLYLLRSG